MPDRRMNLRSVGNIDARSSIDNNGRFALDFHDSDKGHVVVHLEWWFLRHLAEELWKVQRETEAIAARAARALRGEQP